MFSFLFGKKFSLDVIRLRKIVDFLGDILYNNKCQGDRLVNSLK